MARKEKKYHFIYKTTNLLNGKYYIGMHSTDNLNDGYMGSGKRLRYSINKHGKENHKVEILEFFGNRIELKEKEKNIVDIKLISQDNCLNLMTGGEGGLISEEHHKKMRQGSSLWWHEKWKDEKFRAEHNERSGLRMVDHHKNGKIKYDTFTGKKHKKKSKQKMSYKAKLRIGESNSQFGTCWITKDGLNKKIKKEELNSFISLGWNKGRK